MNGKEIEWVEFERKVAKEYHYSGNALHRMRSHEMQTRAGHKRCMFCGLKFEASEKDII